MKRAWLWNRRWARVEPRVGIEDRCTRQGSHDESKLSAPDKISVHHEGEEQFTEIGGRHTGSHVGSKSTMNLFDLEVGESSSKMLHEPRADAE